MMTDSKSDEPEDLIEPLPGNNIYLLLTYTLTLSNYVVTHWALSIGPKIPGFSKQGQIVCKFPANVSRPKLRKSLNFRSLASQPKKNGNSETRIKWNGNSRGKFLKLVYIGCPLFLKFRKMLFHLPNFKAEFLAD